MATEISVPVRLKVLQDSISEFLKILDNLLPNTKNWKDLSRLISLMTSESLKLLALLSTPFSSLKLFNQTEKTIDKLEEAAARVAVVMQGLQFSDIKLTPAQTLELLKFNDEINKIRESYKLLQEEVKEKLLSDTHTSDLIGSLKGDVLSKNFSEIESAVDTHINNLKKKVDEKNLQYEALLSNKRMGESATQLVTNGLSAGSIGSDIFDKFLRLTDKGLLIKFWNTGVTKQALLDAIGEMYHLEPGELLKKIEESLGKTLNQINIQDINKWFSEKGVKSGLFSGITLKGKKATTDAPVVSLDLESLRALLREYELIALEITRLTDTNLTPANALNEAQIAELTKRFHELQAALFGNSDAMNSYKSGAELMRLANEQLRNALRETNAEYLRLQAAINSFNAMKNTIVNFMGFYLVLNLIKSAIKEAANHIKELDSVMNKISIVTDMDSSDLWGLIDLYSAMALKYGASIKGAYEVSQIYYQLGLDTADVLTLTNETLKLSKISGMDYAATTDYMTTAIRGFKMEMSEASTVVDVYSNLASNTAVSQEELAVAMSKTASSMESVGSTFEETSAMIATMVAVTRESATNIGSAMKSIASRYGELTKDPSTLLDSEGEALSFNKVDTALLSVGISMKTTTGLFKEFTDVILELGEKWDQLESTQLRYIATLFAGNRLQSRFLALVSNVDLLKENIENAENSEGIGDLLAIKALDSIENKIEQVRVAYQLFYTTIGVENVWKFFLDGAKNTVNALNGMPKLFNVIPLGAIAAVSLAVNGIKKLAISGLANIAKAILPVLSAANPSILTAGQKTGELWIKSVIGGIKAILGLATTTGAEIGTHLLKGLLGTRNNSRYNRSEILKWQTLITDKTTEAERLTIARELGARGYLNNSGMLAFLASNEAASGMLKEMYKLATLVLQRMLTLGNAVLMVGSAFSILSLTLNDGSRAGKTWAAVGTLLTGVISAVGIAISTAVRIAALEVKSVDNILKTIPWYTALSAIVTVITGIVSVIRLATLSLDNEIEDANKRADELSTKAKEALSNLKSFEQEKKKIEELEKTRYDSAEAAKEYLTAVDNLADSYPQLVQNYNAAGEAVLNLLNMESLLADIRMLTAEATYAAALAELEANKLKEKKASNGLHTANDTLGGIVQRQWLGSPEEVLAYKNGTNELISGSFLGYMGLSGDARLVFLLLEALHNAAESNNIESTISAYNELFNYLNEADLYLSQDISDAVDKIRVLALEALGYTTNISNNSKAIVTSFLNGGSGKLTANVLLRSDGLFNIVSEALYDKMSKDNVDFNSENLSSYYELLFGNLDDIYDNLSDALLALVDKILSNPTSYTIADITSLLSEYGIQIDEWLVEIILQKLLNNKEALLNKIELIEKQGIDATPIKNIVNDENNFITLDERQLLNRGLDLAATLRKNGYNELNFLSEFIKLYQGIVLLPAEIRNDLIAQLLNNGFTNEGLVLTKLYIEQLEIDLDMAPLMGLIELIIPNIQLTIDSIMNSLSEELEDFDSLTSDLSNGVKASKLQKTIDTAKNLGIELERSDFVADGDKFIINYEKYKEVLSLLKNSYEELLGILTEEVEKAYNALGKNINDIDSARLIFGGDFDKYYELGTDGLYTLKSEYNNADFLNIAANAKEKAIEAIKNYNQYLNDLFALWRKSLDWLHGNYSSLSTLGLETFTPGAEIDRIKELIYHPESLTEAEAALPDVLNAIEQYQKGWNTVLTDLTTHGVEYIESHSALYQGLAADEITSLVNDLLSEDGETIPEAISRVAKLAGKNINEINSTVLEWVKKNSNFGKENALGKLVSGFTLDSLESYISTSAENKDINAYINKDGSLKGALANVYEWDEASSSFRAKEGILIDQVFEAWREATGQTIKVGSDLHLQILKDWVDSLIKESEKNDKFTQGISTLTSAKAGQQLNIVGMDSRIVKALRDSGVEIVNNLTKALTQALINATILAAAKLAEEDGWGQLDEWERLVAQEAAEKIQASTSQYDALAAVMKDTVSSSEAKTWAAANGMDDARAAMSQIGYEWDENLGIYVSTADSIIALEKEIADLESADNNDATLQKVASLRALLADLKYTSSEAGKKYQAVNGVIENPEKVSNLALEQLRDAFSKETLNWTESDWNQFITDNGNGTSSINIVEFLQEVGYNADTLFSEIIALKALSYILALSNVLALASEGTTDYTEIEKFNQTIDKLVEDQYLEGGVVGEAFNYDALTKTYKLTTEAWNTYVEGETNRLKALKYGSNEIKDILTKLAADNIDYETLLKSGGSIAESNLKNLLLIWLSTKYGQAANEATLQFYISSFEQGGEAALAVALEIAADSGKELSTEEIEAFYRALVAPIKAIADSLSELKVNSIVAKNLIEILRTAGFSVDENGVITAVGDMVAAYRSIYNLMKATGEATTAELNAAFGAYLDNRDRELAGISALLNATNMTYSQFTLIFTDAGMELTETMFNSLKRSGVIKHLGGNKMMIADFDAFARRMDWSLDSEEYINALSEYRDGIISYDKKLGDSIKANFDSITNAKVGDKINLTLLLSKFPEFEAELEATFGDIITKGVLTVHDALTLPLLAVAIGNKAVQEGGMLAEELEAFVASVHDNILNGITGAFDYSAKGTNSIANMQAFVQEYNTLTGENKDYSELFEYDTLFDTFKLSGEAYQRYLDALKALLELMGLSGEAIDEYIKDLTDTVLRNSIELDSFLNADNKSRNDEANKLFQLIRGLSNYFDIAESAAKTYFDRIVDSPEEEFEAIIAIFDKGGQDAVDLLKQIKPDASQEELENAFNSQINKLNDVMNQVDDLVAGLFVGTESKLYEILKRAGAIDPEAEGVVAKGFSMVKVYAAIYAEMSKTADATTAGLNDAYAKLLTAQDQTNIDITEALLNGNGISYTDFGNLLAKYDISFEKYMTEHYDAVMRDGFGNIRITDWNAFAESIWKDNLDLVKNTLEYTSAFKAYNDGLIELNQTAENAIVEEIQSISGAKGGDWLNMTALWSGLLSIVSAAISNITPQDYKGNVDLANRPIVPADKMKEVFAGFEDDYATLYSENFMSLDFGDFSKNAGMLFTTISASGEIVGDLYSYVKALYDEAAGDTDRMRELDKVSNGGKGLMLFGELSSSYEKLNQYAQDLHDRGAVKDTIGYYLQVLKQYDATLENGILKLGDNANMFGVASTIRDLIDASGIEITNGLAEIQDAIQEVLKSYAEAITKGILGGLTNAEVDDLIAKAQDFGITDLQFTETADGFLLAETSAILLYSALKSIDALHAEQAFDALSESLEKSNEHFKTTGALMAHITSIRKDLYSADDKISNARKALYEAELAVAEEILAVRSTTEDESFKFMDLAIPAGQNNPLNYWEGWQKAFNAINESKKTKRMDYTDFYNLMTEMGNLSTMLGGKGILIGKDLEVNSLNYTDLITQAARNLTSTASDTDLKVNLPAINVDFSSAENMVGDVLKGIQAVADEQINMLDGLIAMLETVVAMEKLGDVAGGGDTPDEIDLGDIFPEIIWDENGNAENLEAITAYDKDYQGFLDWIEVQRGKNKDLNDALDLLKVNGMSLSDIFGLSAHDLAAKGKEFNQAYVAFLEGMRKAALSGNYDVDNIMASVLQVLAESGITDLTIDTGKSTMIIKGGVVTTLDWEIPETQTILAEVDANTEKAKELITQAMENYLAGKESGNKVTLELILKLRHHILVNDEGIEYIQVTTPDGKDKVFANDTNENHWLAAQAEKLLEDMGLDPHKLTKEEYEGGYAQTTTTIGNINNIQVRAEGGLVSFNTDGSATAEGPDGEQFKLHGSSQLEVINNFVEDYKNKEKKLNISTEKMLSEAEIQWKLGIRASLAATIVNDLGKGIDFANEPAIRKEIEKFVNEGLSTDKFTPDGKGNYNVTIADLTYTISGASIETDGKLDLAKAAETLLTSTGLDLSLSRTITQGIADAIPSLTTALNDVKPGPISEVASAITDIGENAQTALTSVSSLVDKIKELHELNGSEAKGKTSASSSEPSISGKSKIKELQEKGGTIVANAGASDIPLTPVEIPVQLSSDELINSATEVGLDASNAIATGIESGEKNVGNAVGSIRTHITELGDTATAILSTIKDLLAGLLQHVSITGDVEFKTPFGNINGKSGIRGENGKINFTVEGEELILEIKDEASLPVTMPINANSDAAKKVLDELIATIKSTYVEASVSLTSLPSQIQSQIDSRTYTANVQLQSTGGLLAGGVVLAATGNIGLAKAKGTLMGELGPELVVSNGRYFVAGLNGAEMVNLADDAIVFNHLQTEQLLKHGMSSGRGKAVTSEKNAVAFATGNTGPAMASASAALNALKQLRAMWESLRSASVSDLAGAGGGGGGGGGDEAVDPSIWIDTVERWYNLMQKIAKLEKEITHEETLRSKLESDWNANGNHYYASQKRSLEALRDLIDAQEQLNLSRLAYYDLRVEALEKSPFGKLIRFDDEGQMFFLEGAMEWLTKLAGFDSEGKANYTDEEKYDILMKAGYGDYMKYDSDGGEIKKDSDGDGEVTDDELQTFYGNATKAFWDRIDDYKETTLSLWDSIKDGEDSLLDLQADLNSLLEEIRENQMEVEDEVLKAIEDLRQREIDALQDERDKLEESTLKYIDGLTDALNREQEMYLNLEDETSLNQQRRRLAILQRSGGSAEDIASLRSEIDSSERERYFNLQQQQIDAILAASDLEIERMDSLIEIMTETLEYLKEYGLLWGNVYAVMQESADKIVSFITHGNSEFWTSSELASQKAINEQLFAAEQWTSYREDLAAAKASIGENGVTAKDISENVLLMATMTREQMKDNDYSIFDEAMKKEFGNDYDKNGAYKDLFYSEYQEHGDLTKVTASARKKYSDDKKAAEAAKAAVKAVTSTGSGGGGGESGGDGGSSGGSSSGNKKQTYDVYDSRGFKTSYTVEASSKAEAQRLIAEKYGSSYSATTHTNISSGVTSTSSSEKSYTSSNTTAAQTQNQNTTRAKLESKGILPNTGTAESAATTKTIEQSVKTFVNNSMNTVGNFLKSLIPGKKAGGGYVNHGVYELGELGTETVLTASQTKVLRDNILSNRPNSLISLLRSYNENYDGINSPLTGITPVEDNSVTIERVEMTMEVKQIANDYDAKRAGEQALNEIMRIARKTGATNSIRR